MSIRNYLVRANRFLALTVAGTVSLLCCWPAATARGQVIWSGTSGTDLNWSTSGNWNPAGPVAGGVTFNNTGGTSGSSSTTSSVDQNFTIDSLTFANTGSSGVQNLSISGAMVLSVSGASGMLLGTSTTSGNTTVYFNGPGGLSVSNPSANVIVGPGTNSTASSSVTDTLNMSGLGSFTFSGSNFSAGICTTANRSDAGIVYLASTSSITASGIVDIGDSIYNNSANENAGPTTSALYLSGGTNTISTDTMYVGRGKQKGTLAFNSTATSAAVVSLYGAGGPGSRLLTFNIGDHYTLGSGSPSGVVDFSKGEVLATVGTMNIPNNPSGFVKATGSFQMGTNPNSVFDVTAVNVANASVSSSFGTLQIQGGTFAFGTLNTSNGTGCTILFQGGTIASNAASSTATVPFHLGVSGNTAIVTLGQTSGSYTGSLTFNAFNGSAGTLDGSTTLYTSVPTTIGCSLVDGAGGATALTKDGPALLLLGGSNAYSAGTTVQNGTLQLGNSAALGNAAAALGVNGGVLDLNGNSPTVGAVTLAGGSIINTGGAASLNGTAGYTLVSGTASAALGGGGGAAAAMNGPGLVLLSGANTYGGGTTVSGGTLQLGNPLALGGSSGALQINAGVVDLNGQTVAVGNLAGAIGGTLTSTANGGILVLTPTVAANFSGTIAGAAGITLNAPGVAQTLGAANSYTGPTTVNAGTLALGNPGTLGSGVTTISPSATLDVSSYGSGGYNFTSGTLAAGPTPTGGTDVYGSLNVTGAVLSVAGGTGSKMTIAGNLALSSGTVTLNQGSKIVLTGGGALSLSGTETIAPLAQLATGVYTLFTYSSLAAGGTSDLAMGGLFGSSPRQSYKFGLSGGTAVTLTVAGQTGNLFWTGAGNGTWFTGAGSQNWYNLNKIGGAGADVFYAGDAVTFSDSGGNTAALGAVTISGTVQSSSLTVSNTAVSYTFGGSGSIGNGTSLVKNGPGSLSINNSNSYTGGTVLNAGVINANVASALGSGTISVAGGVLNDGAIGSLGGGAVTVGGGTLNVNNAQSSSSVTLDSGAIVANASLGSGGISVAGGTLSANAAQSPGSINLSGGLLVSIAALSPGAISMNGGTLQLGDGTGGHDGTIAVPGGILANNATLNYDLNGTQNPAYAINGSGSLLKTGAGTLILSGANSYGGDTMIAEGTLQVGGAIAIPNGATAGNVVFTNPANSAILDLNGIDATVNGLSQPSPSSTNLVVNNLSGTSTLTVGNNDATSTFAGVLADNTGSGGVLALSKIGAGVFTLAGANTYSGLTSISGGTLAIATSASLPATATVKFSGTGTLGIGGLSQTLANMTFADNANATITGTAGSSLACSPATLAFSPATASAASLTVSMSNIGAFAYDNPSGTMIVSQQPTSGNVATATVVTLSSGTNAITAATLNVGSNNNSSSVPHNTLNLGASNSLAVDTINVGNNNSRPQGAVQFAAGLTNPVLTITGAAGAGSTANLTIGIHDSNVPGGGPYHATDTFDTTGGVLYAQLGSVVIGREHTTTSSTPRGIVISSSLNMGAGELTANSMSIGHITSTTGGGAPYDFNTSGAFNLTGGTANITTLTLASNNFAAAVSTSYSNTLSGQVTLNGGANLYATTIQEGTIAAVTGGSLNVISQVNWNNGTIGNLPDGDLSVSGPDLTLVVSGTGTQDAFLISTGQTGAVNSTISGSGALASVGPGTLVLSGTNNFTGGLFVTNGTVILTNSEAIADGTSLTVGDPSLFSPAPIVPSSAGVVAGLPTEPQAAVAPVPEPSALALVAVGAIVAGGCTWRRRKTAGTWR